MTGTPDDPLRALLAQRTARDQAASARIFGTGHQAENKKPDPDSDPLPDAATMLSAAMASMEGDEENAN